MKSRRVDDRGRAYKGSQLQIQIYVNRRPDELNCAISQALPELAAAGASILWVSPLEDDGFREYQDSTALERLELATCRKALAGFWPSGGPVWDALARMRWEQVGRQSGVLLVEAKSYPDEMRSNGCRASHCSLARISAALQATKRWLGADENADWIGPLYQWANRLAHLYFFREVLGLPAWLVHLCFLNDSHRPTGRVEWSNALARAKSELGIAYASVPHVAEVYLEARGRRDLV